MIFVHKTCYRFHMLERGGCKGSCGAMEDIEDQDSDYKEGVDYVDYVEDEDDIFLL